MANILAKVEPWWRISGGMNAYRRGKGWRHPNGIRNQCVCRTRFRSHQRLGIPSRISCRDKVPTRSWGKILARQYFVPDRDLLENHITHFFTITCVNISGLACRLIFQLPNDENMNIRQAREINEREFETDVLHSRQPALVAFVASWSQACGRIEPVLEEVANRCDGAASVFKVDVDDNPDLGTEYGIQSVPTLIFFHAGAVRVKIIGTVSARAILAKLHLHAPERQLNGQPHEKHPSPIGGEI